MRKILYITIGYISMIFGVVGIFIPGLPTTPFLLLSSWLFYKSSKRLHDALHRSRWFGPYLQRFQDRQGVSWWTKSISIVCMWSMISISAFCFFEPGPVRLVLIGLGVIGSTSILIFVPTGKGVKKRAGVEKGNFFHSR